MIKFERLLSHPAPLVRFDLSSAFKHRVATFCKKFYPRNAEKACIYFIDPPIHLRPGVKTCFLTVTNVLLSSTERITYVVPTLEDATPLPAHPSHILGITAITSHRSALRRCGVWLPRAPLGKE